MLKFAYDKINEFCNNVNNNSKKIIFSSERAYIWKYFTDSYIQAISRFQNEHNEEPTDEKKQEIINSLLVDNILYSYLTTAENEQKEYRNGIEKDLQKTEGRSTFWKSIFSSVLANLIYSVILIFLFWVAKDHIYSLLSQLIAISK